MNAAAITAAPKNMYVHYNSALIHAHFGDTDQALLALERAVELEYQTDLLPVDPGLRSLRGQERFERLVADGSP